MRFQPCRAILAGLFFLLAGLAPAHALTPLGEPLPLLDQPGCREESLDTALLPGGGFVAVWTDPRSGPFPSGDRVLARVFDAAGQPLAPPRTLVTVSQAQTVEPVVAADAAGRVLIAWYDFNAHGIRGRIFDATLAPQGEERTLFEMSQPSGIDAAAPRSGGFALLTTATAGVRLWSLDAAGELLSSTPLPPSAGALQGLVFTPQLVPHGRAGLVAVWSLAAGDTFTIEVQIIPSDLQISETITVGGVQPPGPFQEPVFPHPSIASGAAGTVLVTWLDRNGTEQALHAVAFRADGTLWSGIQRLDGAEEGFASAPRVVADSAGGFLVLWQSIDATGFGLSARRISSRGEMGERQRFYTDLGSFEQPLAMIDAADRLTVAWGSTAADNSIDPCDRYGGMSFWRFDADPGPLTLQGDRFEVHATWTDHAGNTGEGKGVAVTGDSGFFWFFDPANVEIMVKVLDGRPVNGHFWVFYASLSDVAYTLTVTDKLTGETRTYENPAGQLASRADTSAFPGSSTGAAPVRATVLETDRAEAAAVGLSPADSAAGPCTPPNLPTPIRPGLCLNGRFEVEVAWTTPAVGSGAGQGVRLTEDSGYFWFFSPENIELVVKVLDGRPINGHFWVFYGALSDVEYTLTVRDTLTGATKTYHNPAGQLASHADVEAL